MRDKKKQRLESAAAIAEAWKGVIDADLKGTPWYEAESGASRRFFYEMADLGFCTVMSQEGKCKDGAFTERAAVIGYMDPRICDLFWHAVNLTEMVCTVEPSRQSVPITYTKFDGDEDNRNFDTTVYAKGGVLQDALVPLTLCLLSNSRGRSLPPAPLPKDWAYVQVFDPKHGRPAKRTLYPTILRCLKMYRDHLGA